MRAPPRFRYPVSLLVVVAVFAPGVLAANRAVNRGPAAEIPAFARLYRTGCSTCHTAAPKLNVLGEAYRLAGYRLPENRSLLRRDEPLPLGDEEWKEEWPRAIWPGEIPGQIPLALRIVLDARWTRDPEVEADFSYRFPHEIYLLAGAPLGKTVSTFLEAEWSREEGVDVRQAKLLVQDVFPGLPADALNVWLGLQNAYLFSFADRQIDRAGRLKFLWQEFRAADLSLADPLGGDPITSENGFRLELTQPSVEINGLAGGRLHYGVGLGQGAAQGTDDDNDRKDIYYRLRYKLGGLDLRGQYEPGAGPVTGAGGQLLDRSLIIEHFGYFGAEPVAGDVQDEHRAFGVAARALYERWDVGVGYVRGHHDRPWGTRQAGELDFSSVFGKAELLVFPWLIGSLKIDRLHASPSLQANGPENDLDRVRAMPGVIALVRQNVRVVVEGELFLRDERPATPAAERPHSLWIRVDFAF